MQNFAQTKNRICGKSHIGEVVSAYVNVRLRSWSLSGGDNNLSLKA